MDIYSTDKRSQIMAKISGKKTKPEILVGALLSGFKYRYRKNDKTLPGTPDIVIPRLKRAVFVNGCFWHSHRNCNRSKLPTTHHQFWKAKIAANVKRDKRVRRALNRQGWKMTTVWQCQINKSNEMKLQRRLARFITRMI